ncbi:hypothetical protein [Streptomyces chartreusis]
MVGLHPMLPPVVALLTVAAQCARHSGRQFKVHAAVMVGALRQAEAR